MKLTAAILIAALALQGCAGVVRPAATANGPSYRPTVDLAAPSTPEGQPGQFEHDLFECNQFAVQVDSGKATANGAIAGAVVATVIGALLGLRGSNLAAVSAYGAAAGGTRNAVASDYANLSQYQIVQRCLIGRGYSVLQ